MTTGDYRMRRRLGLSATGWAAATVQALTFVGLLIAGANALVAVGVTFVAGFGAYFLLYPVIDGRRGGRS